MFDRTKCPPLSVLAASVVLPPKPGLTLALPTPACFTFNYDGAPHPVPVHVYPGLEMGTIDELVENYRVNLTRAAEAWCHTYAPEAVGAAADVPVVAGGG